MSARNLLLLAAVVAAVLLPAGSLAATTTTYEWVGDFHHQFRVYLTTTQDGAFQASTTFVTKTNTRIVLVVERLLAPGVVDLHCGTDTTQSANCQSSIVGNVASVSIPDAPAGDYVVIINPWKGGKNSGVLTVTAET